MDELPPCLRAVCAHHRRQQKHRSLVTRFPSWIAACFGIAGRFEVIRRATLGNLFGSYFCLMQDDVLDGDNTEHPELLLVASHFFLRCTSEFQVLFDSDAPFWVLYRAYWTEYWESLAWEKTLASAAVEVPPDVALAQLGRKLSPLKISAASVALAAGDSARLSVVERMIEHFHAGVQVLDDVGDAAEDLARGRCSYLLHRAALRAVGEPRGPAWEALCREHLQLGAECLTAARALSVAIGCLPFTRLMDGLLGQIARASELASGFPLNRSVP
ncbi:hypothetical protein JY651_13685 [Pyxidicoccus parkwayensis]|uniref:Uncharacterized protein n=1 Tax=Pyxidicoccus parkwayensis TaxID=2813578 RepID=A0ABX7P619_9BACT|nr:hypothetical protein [Pyxidicoccus parkwaysis]QSQ25911.1 hypothetical protein JY651_13685 [Pyxidicoccus parkwaysis]